MTSFQPGDTLGRYRIERPLGHGAMGDVYLGRDPQIDRPLALKTLRLVGVPAEELDERKERMLREARTAGRLIHPRIVTLFDAGEQDGILFLAFEYVDGSDLGRRLASGPLPVGEALRVAREACEGLAHAHRQGIVHRDVKPTNLMLDREGRVKIADFGIAKMQGQGTELTVTGSVMGSPHYLSPEQVRGEELDGRSDLFSLGIVLYEALAGRRPFQGETISTLVYQILGTEPPVPGPLVPGLEPHLPQLLDRFLAKDREERIPDARTAADAVADLEGRLPAELLAALALRDSDPTDATVVLPGTGSGEARPDAAGPGAAGPAAAESGTAESAEPGGPGTAGVGEAAGDAEPGAPAAGAVPPPPPVAAVPPPPPPPAGAAGGTAGTAPASPPPSPTSPEEPAPAAVSKGGVAGGTTAAAGTGGPSAGGPHTDGAGTGAPANGDQATGGTYAVPGLRGRSSMPLVAAVVSLVLLAAVALGSYLYLGRDGGGEGEGSEAAGILAEADLPADPQQAGEDRPGGAAGPGEAGEAGAGTAAAGEADAAARPGAPGSRTAGAGTGDASSPDPATTSPGTTSPGGDRGTTGAGLPAAGAPADPGGTPRRTPSRSSPEAGSRDDAANPGVANPGVANPGGTGPGGADPGGAAPGDSGPGAANPGAANPGSAPSPDATVTSGLRLGFEVFPPDAFVLVNGTVVGRASEYGRAARQPYTLPNPGTHRITFRRDGMEDYHVEVRASGSIAAPTPVRARMTPLKAAEIPWHELEMHRVGKAISFKTDTPNARVLVNDEPVGLARQYGGGRFNRQAWLELPLGQHRVSLIAPGRQRVDFAVDVSSGALEERKRIEVVLPPLTAGSDE